MWPKSLWSFFAIIWWMARHLSATNIMPFLTSRCSVTVWDGCRGKTERKPVGDSRHEIFRPKDLHGYERWQLSPCAVFFLLKCSGSDSLPSSGSTESKTPPLCYWFEHFFPEQQVQETGVVFAMSPAGGEKCFQHNIRLKNIHCKCEIIKGGKIHVSMRHALVKW